MASPTKSEESPRAFKNWFDGKAARNLADQVQAAHPSLDRARFVRLATRDLEALEFHGRVDQFARALADVLPKDVPAALDILSRSLPPPLPSCDAVTDGWLQWPIGHFIAAHGLPHFEPSMQAMVELTQRFSAEFAVRPFVEHRSKETFEHLSTLTTHPSPHVRRWCSEGTRPRLPWGKRLVALTRDPSPIWPILDALQSDPERYVQRSVANNLNDIAKDHPRAVIERCRAWLDAASSETTWIVKHALRSLVKGGDPDALSLLGFAAGISIEGTLDVRPKRVDLGGTVTMSAHLLSRHGAGQDLVVDYAVHFRRANGRTSPKVFKWTTLHLDAHGESSIAKRHAFRKTTVRVLYPGQHLITMLVNGKEIARATVNVRGA
ncbi:MAG: DNA alkylation repair protein [Myxococcales bacterium]|nr:DNA alkylation repair protein [Myxococcales bacterium]